MIDVPTGKRGSLWRELPILIGVAVVVAILVRSFLLQTFYIPSVSMENTLLVNDRVFVNKLVYDFREPRRGEILVFHAPLSWRNSPDEEDFIKRVIGLPGDHVMCCDAQRRLVINGQPLDEPYLYSVDGVTDAASEQVFDVTVPPGRLWVMGDHRSASGDSREHYLATRDPVAATIPISSVVGRAFLLFWPLDRASWLSVPDNFSAIPDPPR